MGLADLRALENLTYAHIHPRKVLHGDLLAHRLHRIGIAVDHLLFLRLRGLLRLRLLFFFVLLFRVGHGRGEVQKVHVALRIDGVQEQIQPGSLLLVDQKLVYILEELSLNLLQFLCILQVSDHLLRNGIQLLIQAFQIIASLRQESMQQGDFFFLFFI